ncbi:Zn-ribbon domain-containing OB-fold protein [Aquibacillus salsiterrae]|uniref:OB-fold domain-containing protein n=1 Tax=Aquibacillus salsiterrae TaxID=2950439 RepID=A0A9X4AF40_9BACI|nr:OB-fold domain-containing protein [Aquibacillus salsiterrae]MDC3415855.1 OB-fold domain-containing protein [Aquibacillus salsiterrae]
MEDKFIDLTVPGPTITPVSKPFWDALSQDEFVVQRCLDCTRWVFYPRNLCPHCWSNQLEWQQASGKARLKTWSIVHRPGHPAWQAVAPYVVAIVELEEGPSMMTHLLVDVKQKLDIGTPLELCLTKVNDRNMPFFRVVD